MNLELFKSFAENNNWAIILPEIVLGVLALSLLIVDIFLKKRNSQLIYRLGMLGQFVVLGLLLSCLGVMDPVSSFSGLIEQNTVTQYMRVFFLVCSIAVFYMASIYFAKREAPRLEFYHIVLVVTAGMMLLVQSSHFLMMFVALETVTVGFYVLVSYGNSSKTMESGVKYLILGALSSGMMLFGIVLLYGIAGNSNLAGYTRNAMDFVELSGFISANTDNLIVILGTLLVLVGVSFKIAVVPFHMWVPDVYEASPMPVTAFLAVGSKAAGFVLLINLLTGPFVGLKDLLVNLLSVVAIVTILLGSLAALGQRNVKRLMGLSGVIHAGYLLMGVIAIFYVNWAIYAVLFYLTTYLLATFAVFIVMSHKLDANSSNVLTLNDFEMLNTENPFLAGILTIGLGSLAGIPPLAGFVSKFLIFVAAFKAGLYWVLAFALLGVMMSIYYYFGWIREMFFMSYKTQEITEESSSMSANNVITLTAMHKAILVVLSVLIIVLGVYQGFWGSLLAS